MADRSNPTLVEAVAQFLAGLAPEQRQENQQELNKFLRWYGVGRYIADLGPREVEAYAESIGITAPDYLKRLEPVKEFLTHAKKKGLTRTNLGVHLKVSKGSAKKKPRVLASGQVEEVELTAAGLTALQQELEALRQERPRVLEEIRRAAADKDVRENAPLEAARERHGQVEGRIRELEAILRSARLLREQDKGRGAAATLAAGLGYTVTLRDLSSNRELRYKLVNPREANPTVGKLSIRSPVGQALVDRLPGEVIEVAAPRGTSCYRIENIER